MLLHIEPDHTWHHLFSRTFQPAGLPIVHSKNGLSAIKTLSRLTPDAIVTELVLPDLEWQYLFSLIRAQPDNADVPIFALTSQPSREIVEACLRLGCGGYMLKSEFDPAIMRAYVNIAMT